MISSILLVSQPIFPLLTPTFILPVQTSLELQLQVQTFPTAGFLSHPTLSGVCLEISWELTVSMALLSLTPLHVQWSLSPEDCALPVPLPDTHPALLSPVTWVLLFSHLYFGPGVLTVAALGLVCIFVSGAGWGALEPRREGNTFPQCCVLT